MSGCRRYRLAGLVALGALALPMAGAAQVGRSEAPTFGLTAAFDRASLHLSLPVCGNSDCGTFSQGVMERRRLGARVDLPALIADDLGLSLRAEWGSSTLDLVSQPGQVWLYDQHAGASRAVEQEFRYHVTTSRFALGGLVGLRLLGPLKIGLGARGGLRLASAAEEKEQLDPNSSVTFEGGQSARAVPDGTPFTASLIATDALAAAWTELPLGRRLALSFEVGASYGLLGESKDWGERGVAITTSLSLLLLPGPAPSPVPPVVAMPQAPSGPAATTSRTVDPAMADLGRTPAKHSQPSASLSLYGIGDEGASGTARVDVRERVDRSVIVVAPVVRFPHGSSALPADCDASTDGAATLSVDSIAEEVGACRLLDLIGMRMRSAGDGRITLRPGRAAPALQDERCSAVRAYLERHWEIAPDRVTRTPGAGSDADAVEIETGTADLLAPLRVESISRTFASPKLKIEPFYQAEAGLRHWEIVLSHRDVPIARYESSGAGAEQRTDYDWHPDYDAIATDTSGLVALFTVVDSTGAQATATARIRLGLAPVRFVVERKIDERRGKETISWSIPENAGEEIAKTVAAEIVETARREDRIVIAQGNSRAEERIGDRGDRLRELLLDRMRRSATMSVRLERRIGNDGG